MKIQTKLGKFGEFQRKSRLGHAVKLTPGEKRKSFYNLYPFLGASLKNFNKFFYPVNKIKDIY